MALAHVNSSTWVFGTGAVTPTVPTNTAAGQLVIITLQSKYDDAVLASPPAGWNDLGAVANTGFTAGNDAGNTRTRTFWKIWQAGDTMPSLSPTNNNVSAVKATTYSCAGGSTFDVVSANLADNTAGTPLLLSTTASALSGVITGDLLHCDMIVNGDIVTAMATPTVVSTGATQGTVTANLTSASTSSGTDARCGSWRVPITAGTASGTVSFSSVLTGASGTNTVGTGNIIRIREIVTKSGSESIAVSTSESVSFPTITFSSSESCNVTVTEQVSRAIVGQNNRMLNPSFENGIQDWTIRTGTATLSVEDVSDAQDGAKVLRVTVDATGDLVIVAPTVPFNPNLYTTIRVAGYLRRVSGTGGSGTGTRLRAERAGPNGELGIASTTTFDMTNVWNRGTSNISSNVSDTFNARFAIEVVDATIGDVYEIDAVQINETSGALPIYDPVSGPVTINKSGSESRSLSISEASLVGITSSASDSGSVSVSDTSAVSVLLSASDSAAVSVSEASQVAVQIGTTDISAVSIADSSAINNSIPTTDTGAVSASEQSALFKTIVAFDTGDVSINEVSGVGNSLPAQETVSVGITEQTAIQVVQSASDSSSIAVSDASSMLIDFAKTASDASAVSVSEVTSGSNTVVASDTASVAVTENSNASAALPGTDSASIGVTEQAVILVTVSTSDSGAVGISDASTSASSLSSVENISISVSDASAVTRQFSTTETASIAVSETTDIQVFGTAFINAADTGGVAVSESSSIQVFTAISATDTSAISVGESRQINTTISVVDSSALSVSETRSFAPVAISASETRSVSVTEVATAAPSIPANETTAIGITEQAIVNVSVAKSDTGAVRIIEAGIGLAPAQHTTEPPLIVVTQPTSDSSIINVDEAAEVMAGITVESSDTGSITVDEVGGVYSYGGPFVDTSQDSASESTSNFELEVEHDTIIGSGSVENTTSETTSEGAGVAETSSKNIYE